MGGAAGLLVLLLVALLLAVVVLSAIVGRDVLNPPRHTAGYAASRGMAFDPGEAGLRFEPWTLERPGGAIPVWEIDVGPGGAGRAGNTIVFVHDWGESRIDVLARLGPWRTLGRRLILFDRPGHGEAGGGALRRGEHDDLLALLEALGEGPLVLVARGTGANVAIAAAARCAPGRILGIVAEQPLRSLRAWVRERLRAAGQAMWPLADLGPLWLRLCGAGFADPAGDLARLGCPVLVVDGAEGEAIAALAPRSARVIHEAGTGALREFLETSAGRATGETPAAAAVAEPVSLAAIAYRHARRLVVLVVGVSVLLVGVVMIVLPGPAFLVIPLGLAILGIEFAWARLWLRNLKRAAVGAKERLGRMVGGSGDATKR